MNTHDGERYAGLDVSKGRLDVALRPRGRRSSGANDPEGIEDLVSRLARERLALVVLKSTGGYERPAAAAIAA